MSLLIFPRRQFPVTASFSFIIYSLWFAALQPAMGSTCNFGIYFWLSHCFRLLFFPPLDRKFFQTQPNWIRHKKMTERYIMEGECVSGLSLMDSRICETLGWQHTSGMLWFFFLLFFPVDFQVINRLENTTRAWIRKAVSATLAGNGRLFLGELCL